MNRHLDSSVLLKFTVAAFRAAGLTDADAQTCADNLVYADLRGIDGHGVLRLSHYLGRLKIGSTVAQARPTFTPLGPALGLVDGNHAMGQVSARLAVEKAVTLARTQGTGLVLVKNGGHFGAAGYYGRIAAENGMITLVLANGDKIVVPFGGRQAFFGSNPLSFVFPTEEATPVCVDMATCAIPYGKIVAAKNKGERIPREWALDAAGQPTDDPSAAKALHPMAAHKGYGLALAIETLTSLLTGSPYGPDIPAMYGDEDKPRELSQFFLVIDPSRFVSLPEFQQRFAEMGERLHAVPPAAGFSRVLLPGEPEAATFKQRSNQGIPMAETLWADLTKVASAHGLEQLLESALKPNPVAS